MATVTVELPADLAALFEPGQVSEEATRLLALELFREEKLSLGRASELCQTPLADFIDFVGRHGVSPLRPTFDDLEEERKSMQRLALESCFGFFSADSAVEDRLL
jgi:predicted HTH domain antitoxin